MYEPVEASAQNLNKESQTAKNRIAYLFLLAGGFLTFASILIVGLPLLFIGVVLVIRAHADKNIVYNGHCPKCKTIVMLYERETSVICKNCKSNIHRDENILFIDENDEK